MDNKFLAPLPGIALKISLIYIDLILPLIVFYVVFLFIKKNFKKNYCEFSSLIDQLNIFFCWYDHFRIEIIIVFSFILFFYFFLSYCYLNLFIFSIFKFICLFLFKCYCYNYICLNFGQFVISLLRNFGEVLRGNQVSEFSPLFIYVFFFQLQKNLLFLVQVAL